MFAKKRLVLFPLVRANAQIAIIGAAAELGKIVR